MFTALCGQHIRIYQYICERPRHISQALKKAFEQIFKAKSNKKNDKIRPSKHHII